jgi:phage repressor protein C with HTH and peptisase S24 domain
MDDESIRIEQGRRLAEARARAGFRSARAAALGSGWPESTYRTHEAGTRTIGQDDAIRYAARFQALGAKVTAADILFGQSGAPVVNEAGSVIDVSTRSGYNPPPEFFGERDLPVFASVEGGDGALILSTEPIDHVLRPWYLKKVKDGYAVLVNGTSMEPRYEPGDMVVVNPKAAKVKGKDIILFSNPEHGVQRAIVKRYMGENAAEWFLRQFNPPEGEKADFRLFKHDWPMAVRVTGSYDGG